MLLDETAGAIMKSPPRLASGQIDGYSLAMMGRPRGINFFVIGSLSDVRFLDEKTGFWLWKNTRYRLRATLRVEIVDSATGTKALDESLWEEMIVDELKYEELEAGRGHPLDRDGPDLGPAAARGRAENLRGAAEPALARVCHRRRTGTASPSPPAARSA